MEQLRLSRTGRRTGLTATHKESIIGTNYGRRSDRASYRVKVENSGLYGKMAMLVIIASKGYGVIER